MAVIKLYNLARMTTATTGTSTITLGSAVAGFLTFALAGVANGETVTYAIRDGGNSEIGRGVYTSAGTSLTRSVLRSTNSNNPISLSGSAQVFITAAAEDLLVPPRSVSVDGISSPHFELYAEDGSTQADIAATTYNVSGGGIFHGRHARGTRASPTASQAGDIIGGYGFRGYHSGGAFHTSSPASIHGVAGENQTSSAFGMYLRFLTTPKGSTTRHERVLVTYNGTLWCHDESTFDATSDTQTKPIADIRSLVSGSTGGAVATGVSYGVFGYGTGATFTVGYRGGQARGTPSSPTATQSGDIICFLGASGYDGSAWTASKAIITLKAAENFSGTNQGTTIGFEATQLATTTRTEVARLDKPTTAGHTALLLWDVDNANLERVTVGAADSGGTGFKVLRIPN